MNRMTARVVSPRCQGEDMRVWRESECAPTSKDAGRKENYEKALCSLRPPGR
jgi:hypothetical protein